MCKFPQKKDWIISDDILRDAVKHLTDSVEVSTKYDVPYVAGYSDDGKTVYIDKDLPLQATLGGKKVDLTPYLVLHEVIEKTLLDNFKVVYQLAHQIALRLEQDAVEADGIDWDEYSSFYSKWIKKIGDEEVENPPPNFDLTPYKDEDDETELKKLTKEDLELRRMLEIAGLLKVRT